MRLCDIKEEYLKFKEMTENGEIPPEAVGDTLACIEGELEEKADNIACIIKQQLYESAALMAEEQALCMRRRAKEKSAERLKRYLSDCLLSVGYQTLETSRNKITFRKSASVEIDDVTELCANHPELVKAQPPQIDKAAVKKLLLSGQRVSGCSLKQKLNMQIK